MKTEELTAIGLTEEQATQVLAMNGKDIEKHKSRITALEGERDAAKAQLETANATLKKFEGIDPQQIQTELQTYKTQAEEAEKKYTRELTQRDQRDWMWQDSSTGKVNGINGNVDTDTAYKDYPTVIRGAKLNGFTSATQKPTAPVTPAPATPTPKPATATFKNGDLVKITGTKYYSGATIPSWVKNQNWYVREVSGARVVIDKNESGTNSICSPVNAADLQLVKSAGANTVWIPKVGDVVKYNGSTHYTSANASIAKSCKGGTAKITQIYQLGKSKHPYHLIHTGTGCTVYGWVDEGTFTKA